MKLFKKAMALGLSLLPALSGVAAYAAQAPSVNEIKFYYYSADKLNMKSLAESGENKIPLVIDGKSDFAVVIPENCGDSLKDAAETLCKVIEEMTGARLPVEISPSKTKSLIVLDTADGEKRPEGIKGDGYRIKTDDGRITVCGADEDATVNGVYGFLEDTLGCMFLTPDDTFVPKQSTVWLEKGDTVNEPAALWRDVYAYETVQNKWAAKLRLNGIDTKTQDPSKNIEQMQYEGWGTWCHDCYNYLSPDEYFETHPEYFSEKNGKRVTEYKGRPAYLCLSNPEVFEIVKNSLAEKIAQNPDKMYWDFSGNDNSSLAGCECAECKAADKAAGGTGMGTLLPFLNKLAKAFPDKYISTLAYLHTLKAPKNIKAEPNVVIKLCSMPGDQASSYMNGANANSLQFKTQVEEWSKITDKIVVWDYVVNFSHLLMPFPNFSVQAENQKFYEDNGIIGVFHQASREKGGEFACLRAYVLSRLMWEGSGMDVAECVSKYIAAYFGSAAPKIIEYMNLCASELAKSGGTLGLYDGLAAHYDDYLSAEKVAEYKKLIDEAKAAANGDERTIGRVEEVELSVTYAQTLLPKISNEERRSAQERLNALCEKRGITMYCEWADLESFNNGGLEDLIRGEKLELNKGLYIAGGVAAGVVLIGAAAAVAVKLIKKKKAK